jgi:ubiquinone/menaquinone biosynthesis C-methylase UbiE
MSAFSASNFNSKGYAQFRPTYDSTLFEFLDKYHTGDYRLAVDIGCGSGQASYPLTTYFAKVIGTDLSHTMINTASAAISDELNGRIEFKQSPAEELQFIEDGSVDLITVAQCVHWFNLPKFFEEVYRVLKPKGTLAICGYADPVFNNEAADKMAMDFTYDDPTKLGPYWEQPGRNICRNLLRDVIPPSGYFIDQETYERTHSKQESPLIIQKEMPFESYGQYVKTWSSYHRWKDAHKCEPDIADMYLEELQAKMNWTPRTTVKMEWLTVLKLARKL